MSANFWTDQKFTKRDYTKQKLPKGDYENCRFVDCLFSKGYLDNQNFVECTFEGCDLTNTNIANTTFNARVVGKICWHSVASPHPKITKGWGLDLHTSSHQINTLLQKHTATTDLTTAASFAATAHRDSSRFSAVMSSFPAIRHAWMCWEISVAEE